MNLTELAKEHTAWSISTFQGDSAAEGLKKLQQELEEVWDAMANRSDYGVAEEYADCIMCLFSSAACLGVSPAMITEAFASKLKVNKGRKWRRNPDGTYNHIKESHEHNLSI